MDASIDAVRVAGTPDGPVPVVVLDVGDVEDVLPIFIGFEEARSIARGMDAIDIGRPLTHDLLLDVLEATGSRVDRVVVTEMDGETYIADLHIDTPRHSEVVDARPSDSLALASRTGAPIEVASGVFESGRRPREQFDELQELAEVLGPDD